ncbi:MAG: flagellar hook-length control protein FliK, partial [Oxalobacteraceae bacterium]|nr:flagellar hook-length control protein FliK [Oxalobacteraceae bacterium]
GMSALELSADAKIRWSVSQPGTHADSAKSPLPDQAPKMTADASQAAAAMSTAQHEKHEAPGRELAATLVLGEAEAKQFAKKLETKQLSLRAERLGSTSSETFKSAFMNNGLLPQAEASEAPAAPESVTLGTDLTGEDLRMIWAHRQSVAEQNSQAQAQGQASSPQSDIDLRAEQYEKLSQRLGEALGQRLASQIARGVWKVELALKPQDLGNIEIKLDMKDGALEASFKATEALTRELITDGLPRLREALAQSGMQVANVNVNVRQDSQNGGNSTPGRNKTPAGISGVSKGSLANASLPADSLATGKPKAQDNNGLDILV